MKASPDAPAAFGPRAGCPTPSARGDGRPRRPRRRRDRLRGPGRPARPGPDRRGGRAGGGLDGTAVRARRQPGRQRRRPRGRHHHPHDHGRDPA
ncbi:MAG TPA: hypothetical protein DCS55_07775, partial [Acidimicrobiaceae bacterium]|nr:hypothetical protein [Acidimicrobiaceae bacterium]